jgi:hypothetical protein
LHFELMGFGPWSFGESGHRFDWHFTLIRRTTTASQRA